MIFLKATFLVSLLLNRLCNANSKLNEKFPNLKSQEVQWLDQKRLLQTSITQNNNCSNCATCVSNKCTQCSTGYYIYSTRCIPCPWYPSCRQCNNGVCTLCNPNMVLTKDKTCVNCSDYMPNCTQCDQRGVCSECKDGFYLFGDMCSKCSENCKNCNNLQTCMQCSNGHSLINGKCVQCSVLDVNCKTCDQNGDCLACNDGYFPLNGKCTNCPLDNCSACNKQGTCINCKFSYVYNPIKNLCISKDQHCSQYSSGNCKQCIEGYILDQNFNCISCLANEYSKNNMCKKCSDYGLCSQCRSTGCSTCFVNSELDSRKQNCKCSYGFLLINKKCVNFLYILVPITVGFFILIGILIFILIRIRNNKIKKSVTSRTQNSVDENDVVNTNGIYLPTLKEGKNSKIDIHEELCIFGCKENIVWQLNCGGFLCNNCSLNVISQYCSKEQHLCLSCSKPMTFFSLLHQYIPLETTDEKTLNQQSVIYLTDKIDDSDKCSICCFFPNKQNIRCNSITPHMLCEYCYIRLMVIQQTKNCPFCRHEIK
jgi:hypothetical protein